MAARQFRPAARVALFLAAQAHPAEAERLRIPASVDAIAGRLGAATGDDAG